jgi:two-component system chemotaxis response regulator CheY
MANILIVDDSNMLRDMLKTTLQEGGYSQVSEACDGAKALNLAKSSQYDLIITDVNMPNMDGFTLLQELRQLDIYTTVPILILTTERDEQMKQRGKDSGATGWIVKPFLPDQLLQAITMVLNRG